MPVFRLEPRKAVLDDPRWESSVLKDGCWVRAKNEDRARQYVLHATKIAAQRSKAGIMTSPWADHALTTCEIDNAPKIDIPSEGIVVSIYGRTFSQPGS